MAPLVEQYFTFHAGDPHDADMAASDEHSSWVGSTQSAAGVFSPGAMHSSRSACCHTRPVIWNACRSGVLVLVVSNRLLLELPTYLSCCMSSTFCRKHRVCTGQVFTACLSAATAHGGCFLRDKFAVLCGPAAVRLVPPAPPSFALPPVATPPMSSPPWRTSSARSA